MPNSKPSDGPSRGDDDEPHDGVPALPPASPWRPTSEQIHGELSDDVLTTTRLPHPRNTRALARLIEGMRALSEAEQRAVVLCRVIRLTHDQAARLLSVKRERVERLLRTADEKLRSLGPDPRALPGRPFNDEPDKERGVDDATYPTTDEED